MTMQAGTGSGFLKLSLSSVKRAAWKHRWQAVAAGWIVGGLLAAAVTLAPQRYEASARIYVDTQTVLKPLMAGLAYQPDIEMQVRMLARTVISRPNVEKLIEVPNLGLEPKQLANRERLVDSLMQQIKFTATGAGNQYSIVYRDKDPERARRIVEATLALFVDSTEGTKRRDSLEATRFIDEQIRSYELKLIESENRLKDFKLRNFGVTGVSNQDYFGRMSALTDEVSRLKTELLAAEQARDTLRRELSSEAPLLPPEARPSVAIAPSELDARLDAQKRQLDELLRRYTEEHPDVANARRVIGQLEQQKRAEEAARSRPGGERLAATSPVYQQIRIQLAETEARVSSLRAQLSTQQTRLDQIRATAGKVPQVEAELAQLNRDYDIMRKNYEALVSRRESASLGVKLDESSHLAEFRVVDPPAVGPGPVAPSRLHLAVLAFLATLAAVVGTPLVLEKLRPTIHDVQQLMAATSRPVLGTVRAAKSVAQLRLERADALKVASFVGLLIVLQAVWVVWIGLPATH